MTAVDVALVVVRLVVGCWLLWSLPRLSIARHGIDHSDVSVLVPARNEADSLPSLLASLPQDVEVVVVDDGSEDDTSAVAASAGATVVRADPLPAGWTGKSWACAQGAARAAGSTIVFVDADVRFGTGGFDRVLATLAREGGLVSVQPFHLPGSGVEHLAALFNVVALAGTDAGSPLGRRAGVAGAFGPVLATSREDYEAAGSHDAVRSTVVDDVVLAAAYRDAGRPVTVRVGADAVAFRMYPEGLRQLVDGFTKNLSAGAGAVRRGTVALVAFWLSLLVQAAFAPLVSGLGGSWETGLGLYLLVAAQFWWMARRVGRFGLLTAILFPVHTGLFLAVFVRSVLATTRGSVSWRGRRVETCPRGGGSGDR